MLVLVLVFGLDPYRVPRARDPKPVADAIDAGMARFAEHSVGTEFCLFGLDGSDDVEEVVAAARWVEIPASPPC